MERCNKGVEAADIAALPVQLELSKEEQGDYASAKGALIKTMMPVEFVSLDDESCSWENHCLCSCMR